MRQPRISCLVPRTVHLAHLAVGFPPFALHSAHTTRSLEKRAFNLSKNDPYKCVSHNARLHEGHTPPLPALKNTPHLSHCQLYADWRKNGGTYTIARV